jgi:predicted O-methyltransferase YrrM
MFDLYNAVFKPRWNANELLEPDALRKKLRSNSCIIEVTDLGAGSKKFTSNQRKISAIYRTSSKKIKYARLISRLIKYFKSETVLELGTSLGVTTVYLSRSTNGKVITVEGCPSIHNEAVKNLASCGCNNVELVQGSFIETLPAITEKIKTFDLAFIDGWHTYERTLFLFNHLLQYKKDSSVLVMDDIHWSPGMEKAWNEIIKHPKVTATIDIFEMGIVFFDNNLSQETFSLKY